MHNLLERMLAAYTALERIAVMERFPRSDIESALNEVDQDSAEAHCLRIMLSFAYDPGE